MIKKQKTPRNLDLPVSRKALIKVLESRRAASLLLDAPSWSNSEYRSYSINTNRQLQVFQEEVIATASEKTRKIWTKKGVFAVEKYLSAVRKDELDSPIDYEALLRFGLRKGGYLGGELELDVFGLEHLSWADRLVRDIKKTKLRTYRNLLESYEELADRISTSGNHVYPSRQEVTRDLFLLKQYLSFEGLIKEKSGVDWRLVHLPRVTADLGRLVEIAELEYGRPPKLECVYTVGLTSDEKNLVYANSRTPGKNQPDITRTLSLDEIVRYKKLKSI